MEDVAYTYDGAGNLTCDNWDDTLSQCHGTIYTYDAANQLTGVDDGVSTTTYTYNGDGDRVAQTIDGVQTTYVLDIATPLTMVIAETTGTETITYLHGLDLIAQSDGTNTEYMIYDGLGSVRQLSNGGENPIYLISKPAH